MKTSISVICLLCWVGIPAFGQGITVDSPDGSADVCRGRTFRIHWTSTGDAGPNVRIRLMQGGAAVQEITSNTPNDGSFDWPVPATVAPGRYTVRVRSLASAAADDSAPFSIAQCTTTTPPAAAGYPMTFSSPARGATLCPGRSHTVRWQRGSITDPRVRIYLLTQALTPVRLLNEVIANSGAYDWTVPAAILGGPHILRLEPAVQDSAAPRILAESPVFQISHCYSVRPAIVYSGPDRMEVCFEQASIDWRTSGDAIRSVDIEFYCWTQPGGIFLLASSAPNNGRARVRFPRELMDALNAHGGFAGTIKIFSSADPAIISDGHDVSFSRCRPTNEQLSQDLVLNPVDRLYLPAALVNDPKCGSCVDLDLGKVKAALGDPSQPLAMILFKSGRKVADLGFIGGGKEPPDQVRESLAPDVYKMFFEDLQGFVIILKTMEGKQAAKIPAEVILQK